VDSILLVTNAQAGTADENTLNAAVAVLRAAADVEVRFTSDSSELAGVLARRGSRRVVVAGGDGTLHAVVAALHRLGELPDTALGLVPLGTGNDFARGTGIPLDAEEAAGLVLTGELRDVDLIIDDDGGVVVNNVHVGVGAQASRQARNWKRWLGRVGYGIGAVRAAFRPPFVRLRVEVDGEVVADPYRPVLQVAIGNGASAGGGYQLNPGADPESGRLDVMVSFAIGLLARVRFAMDLRRSRHLQRDDVLHRRGRTVSVAGEPFYCSADGEVDGPHRSRTWRVRSGAFRMVLPS